MLRVPPVERLSLSFPVLLLGFNPKYLLPDRPQELAATKAAVEEEEKAAAAAAAQQPTSPAPHQQAAAGDESSEQTAAAAAAAAAALGSTPGSTPGGTSGSLGAAARAGTPLRPGDLRALAASVRQSRYVELMQLGLQLFVKPLARADSGGAPAAGSGAPLAPLVADAVRCVADAMSGRGTADIEQPKCEPACGAAPVAGGAAGPGPACRAVDARDA